MVDTASSSGSSSPDDGSSHKGAGTPLGSRRAVRGTAGERLREAGARLLAGATLDDLTAFVTVGRLAEESGLSNGAIYSAYRPSPGIGGRGRSAPQAVVRDMFTSNGDAGHELVGEVLEAVDGFIRAGTPESEMVQELAAIIGAAVERAGRGEHGVVFTRLWLGAATALNDPEVLDAVVPAVHEVERRFAELAVVLLDLTGRELVDGVSLVQLARMLVDVANAGALRVRLEPGTPAGVVARLLSFTFAATTRRVGEEDDDLDQRLVSGIAPASTAEVERIGAEVRGLVERQGWQAVTLGRIQERTGIERSVIVATAPTRHHLATFVWSDVVEPIVRRAAARTGLGPDVQVVELVRDVADAACSRRALVASLLRSRLHDASSTDIAATDTGSDRLVALLTGLLVRVAGGDVGLRAVAARTAVDALLVGAAGSDADAEALSAVLIAGLLPKAGPTPGQ